MALILNLKWIKDLKGKGDRFAKVTFRGSTFTTKTVASAQQTVYFGETFEWPIARSVDPDERLEIKLFNHNKYLSNKLIGSFTLILQSLIKDGELKLSDAMVDGNNRIMEATIDFSVKYYSPDGGVGFWEKDEFEYPLVDPAQDASEFDKMSFMGDKISLQGEPIIFHDGQSVHSLSTGSGIGGEDTFEQQAMLESMLMGRRAKHDVLDLELNRPKDFQICVTIMEAQQLHGLNVDPVIRIQVGDDVKYSSIKQSTNCPFYNEYFVFDYHESPAMLFDKMISITAYDATRLPGRSILRAGNLVAGSTIGVFKCDVGTVYTAPDHQFYRKWAVLINPKDITEGARGFVKCDISVIGKGDIVKTQKTDKDENNIEGNLLLPAGIPMERQRAAYRISIYHGEGLPRMDAGIMASVKKVITRSNTAFVDAYVKVSFIGHVGKTTVKKSYNPEWKEQLTFIDMFPPLCNRIKVQLMDQDPFKDDVIATHFIELPQIMDPGGDTEGILPTFGPCWINFYGSPRLYKIVEDIEELNEGLGEGAAYKGRLLMSVKTELMENEMAGPSTVYRDKVKSSGNLEVAPRREFLLFSTMYDASMIDKEHAGKQVYFELSCGLAGNTLDAKPEKSVIDLTSDNEEGTDDDDSDQDVSDRAALLAKKKAEEEAMLPCLSTTPPMLPQTDDRKYYYLPLGGTKPCLYVCAKFEDLRKRLYHQNVIYRIIDALDKALEDVRTAIKNEKDSPHKRLKYAMFELIRGIDNYTKMAGSLTVGAGSGKTKLDKHRHKSCKMHMEKLRTTAKKIKANVSEDNVRDVYKEARECLRRLKHLAKEPQHSFPDVFLWMVVDNKRIAYVRIPTREILHANSQEVLGKECGKIQTLFLKRPGKKAAGALGWSVQAKVMLYLWFGLRDTSKKIKDYMENLPPGYNEDLPEIQNAIKEPPSKLIYEEAEKFTLRAYLFQARNLIGSDSTGLSDPFARVIMYNQCQETYVVDATLSPAWDQVLVFKEIVIHGHMSMILSTPPIVLVEIFDHDTVGSPEFLGRAMVRPRVKPANVPYEAPDWPVELQWWDVYRGHRKAGELLAAFELLQGEESEFLELPLASVRKGMPVISLPMEIKPKLCKYRIEVMFWGVREIKRIQLMTVDRPRVDVECAGHVVSSKVIANMQKNCNFESPVQYVDLDLPENQFYWPPITIRCVDCRSFGREVLVGVHTITDITKYVWMSPEERERIEEEQRQQRLRRKQEKDKELEKEKAANNPDLVPNGKATLEAGSGIPSGRGTPDSGLQLSRNKTSTPLPGIQPVVTGTDDVGRPSSRLSNNASNKAARTGTFSNDVIIEIPDQTPMVEFKPGSPIVSDGQLAPDQTESSGVPPFPGPPGMPAVPGMPGQANFPGALGMPGQPGMPPGMVPPGTVPKPATALERSASKSKKERSNHRELIAELDWWSKYYIAKEDKEKNADSSDDYATDSDADILSDDNEMFKDELTVMNYEGMDNKKLEKLKELQSGDDEDDEDDPLKKRLKKKGKKKQKKRKKHMKKAAKRMKRLKKGIINKAFRGDGQMYDGELLPEVDEDKSHIVRIKVYESELEKVPDFKGLQEWVHTFDLYRGKKLDDEEDDQFRISAKFKGMICIYKLEDEKDNELETIAGPLPKAMVKKVAKIAPPALSPLAPKLKLIEGLPPSKPYEVLVRIYLIKATDLHPVDVNGMADPYLVIKCGRREISDKENKQNNKLNPVFGKSFDIDAVFPMDSILRIQVMDYDTLSADDLIGETTIDLENRLYSKYRGSCGISSTYEIFGYNTWRDPLKPSQILAKLCKDLKINPPVYKSGQVTVNNMTFYAENEIENEHGELHPSDEHAALEALKSWRDTPYGWPLVPEHIESRTLLNPERPGMEQGKLEMWVDLFPKDVPAPSLPVDITPRKPVGYELRVIVWNTDNVVLDDSNPLTGEASSDIFVRGFLYGMGIDHQSTDVHYRSLDGEGNFNWRFVLPFQYLKAEEKIVRTVETDIFSFEEGEQKQPAKLNLQVWDADIVSADDYLGAVIMDLHRIPRPPKDAKNCTLDLLATDGRVPVLNLFKQKRCKGWWPFEAKDEKTGEVQLVGKVEAELHLMTAEEAEKDPAGLGREAPNPLPEPNRPDSSFLWFMNPLKTLKYIIWKNYKWLLLKLLLLAILIIFLVLFFYNFPGNMVQKIFGT